MTVTMFSITPPTRHTSVYMMRKTQLNGPRPEPLPRKQPVVRDTGQMDVVLEKPIDYSAAEVFAAARVLEDIDDWYSQTIEDDGFLERLDKSAEAVRFP